MNYSDMKNNTRKELTKLVQFLNWDFDEGLIKKSVEFSSFNKVKKMGKKQSQQYGNGPKDGSFKGEFTRSGDEGQFNHKLKKETIDLVLHKFPEFKKEFSALDKKSFYFNALQFMVPRSQLLYEPRVNN